MSVPACPKPPKEPKKHSAGLTRKSKLESRSGLRKVSKSREADLAARGIKLTSSTFTPLDPKRRIEHVSRWKRSTKPWVTPRRLDGSRSEKVRKALKRIGERSKSLSPKDLKWMQDVRDIWETCIITGARPGEGFWTVDADHCYPRGKYRALRHNPANGVLLRHDVHMLAHRKSKFRAALKAIADEALAAQAERRLPVTREEAQGIVIRMFPEIREYLLREVS